MNWLANQFAIESGHPEDIFDYADNLREAFDTPRPFRAGECQSISEPELVHIPDIASTKVAPTKLFVWVKLILIPLL